jgi:sarcosine oxidase subunit beta
MKRYSIFNIARNALSFHEKWPQAWRSPELKKSYDVVIVGGGGHGLATAYYLAKNHGITDIAVIEKSYIGSGNTGRNTEVVRSNYLLDEAAHLYEFSLKLWENLSNELNFNLMFSQRGVLSLGHSFQEMRDINRRVTSNHLNGIDSQILSPEDIKSLVPILNLSSDVRYPVLGGALQKRGGTARHDALVWGYARAADAYGIDIIQHCEVTGIRQESGRIFGIETTKGLIKTHKLGVCVAGNSGVLASLANLRLPIETHPLQAWVSEPIKPILDVVVMSSAVHAYISQTAKGELLAGAGIDSYTGYGQRGSFSILEGAIAAIIELFPIFSRLRLMRQWAGIVDVCPDACPIIGKTPVDGLYFNCGWGTGGYKATPGAGWVFAHTIANDSPHPLNKPFTLDRFNTGRLIDEHGAAGVAH